VEHGLKKLVIWDFDGVICDSLLECITVTKLASYNLEHTGIEITDRNIYFICDPEEIGVLYENMKGLRPFIVKGQDYLWQYYNLELFKKADSNYKSYEEAYKNIYNAALDTKYEKAFYEAREQLSEVFGKKYFSLFKAYPGSLYAFRVTQTKYNTYICTARDQKGVQILLEGNSIAFPRDRIYSRDFNGQNENSGNNKTEQIMEIIERESATGESFILIEDQVKTPGELKDKNYRGKILWAAYGYGHEQDWESAGMQNLVKITHPSQLIFNIY